MSNGSGFVSTSRAPRVEFTNRFVQPPSELYLSPEDRLYVLSWCSTVDVELNIRARVLRPNGEVGRFDVPHVTASAVRTSKLEGFNATEGFLLGIGVHNPGGTLRRGQLYVELGIIRGLISTGSFTHALARGYVEGLGAVFWPGGRVEPMLNFPGFREATSGTTPAVGNPILETVPTNARWRIRSVICSLTTDATVASRRVFFEVFAPGPTPMAIWNVATTQPASATWTYTFSPSGFAPTDASAIVHGVFSDGLELPQGWAFAVDAHDLQAGDQFSGPTFDVEEVLEE